MDIYYRLLNLLDLDQESLPQALITPSPVVLGEHMRRRREELVMTQSEVGLHLGVSLGDDLQMGIREGTSGT